MGAAVRALQSERFSEGVRLISRRKQAELSMGRDYIPAMKMSDMLASAYGIDRGGALSSLNVLTGLKIGGANGRKLSMDEAGSLTKVGGLIAQQGGVPFERVMTNIQQLLVNTTPSIRDIREMMNAAPILGKYALKDMERKDVVGLDVRDYLKNPNNIMSVLARYEADNPTNAGMRARGQIELAIQDGWAKIASNNKAWQFVGQRTPGIIDKAFTGINRLATTLAENPEFNRMTKRIELAFEGLGGAADELAPKLLGLVDALYSKFGLKLPGTERANDIIGRENTIYGYFNQPWVMAATRRQWRAIPENSKLAPDVSNEKFKTWYWDMVGAAKNDPTVQAAVNPISGTKTKGGIWGLSVPYTQAAYRAAKQMEGMQGTNFNFANEWNVGTPGKLYYGSVPEFDHWKAAFKFRRLNDYAGFQLQSGIANKYAQNALTQYRSVDNGLVANTATTNENSNQSAMQNIKAMTGERRALTINFNREIVSMPTTVNASDAANLEAQLRPMMEDIVTRGLTRALASATTVRS